MRPRVLHVSAIGGTAVGLLLPQALAAREAGFNVGFAYSPDPDTSWQLRDKGFDVIETPISRRVSPSGDLKSAQQLAGELKHWKPDIVHTHTSKGGAIGRLAARLYGKTKTIHTVHGFPFIPGQPPVQFWMYLSMEWVMAHTLTDMLLSQSREDVDLAKRYGIRARLGYPEWIGNGVDLSLFNPKHVPKSRVLRKTFNIPDDGIVLLTVARIKQEKGLGEIVEALAGLRDFPWFWFVAGGVEENTFNNRLQQRIQELDLQGRIVFLDKRRDIPELLADTDWFVLPSYREGVPRSLIEAHAMHVPAVTTDVRGCREVCINDKTGFIVPASQVDPLAKALKAAFETSPLDYARMQANARSQVLENFDENDAIERILKSYEQVLGLDYPQLRLKVS